MFGQLERGFYAAKAAADDGNLHITFNISVMNTLNNPIGGK